MHESKIVLSAVRRAGLKYLKHSQHIPAAAPRTQRALQVEQELFHHCLCTAEPRDDIQVVIKIHSLQNKIKYHRNCFCCLI
jgi:hypothetical protein